MKIIATNGVIEFHTNQTAVDAIIARTKIHFEVKLKTKETASKLLNGIGKKLKLDDATEFPYEPKVFDKLKICNKWRSVTVKCIGINCRQGNKKKGESAWMLDYLLGDILDVSVDEGNPIKAAKVKERQLAKEARENKKDPKDKKKTPRKYTRKQIPSTFLRTFKLLEEGFTPEQIAVKRHLTISTISTHIGFYIKKGELNINDFVSQEVLTEVLNAIGKVGTEKLASIKDACSKDITYDKIIIVMAEYRRKQNLGN